MANKKRLIDATDENIKAILEKVPYYPDEIWKFTAMTKRFPTVDAVEVVRCKDCKHWKLIDGLNPHWECQIFCGLHDYGYLTGADDFCSYGERKTNEATQ